MYSSHAMDEDIILALHKICWFSLLTSVMNMYSARKERIYAVFFVTLY